MIEKSDLVKKSVEKCPVGFEKIKYDSKVSRSVENV